MNYATFRSVLMFALWLAGSLLFQSVFAGLRSTESKQANQRTAGPEAVRAVTELYNAAHRHVKIGREAIEKGDYRAAERAARSGLAVISDWPPLILLQGEALMRLGNYSEALAVLTEAKDKFTDQATLARIAYLLAKTGKRDESLRMARSGLLESALGTVLAGTYPTPTGPVQLEAYWLFAIGVTANGDDEATHYYTASQALDPSPIALNRLFGKVHLRNKRYAEAKESFDRVLSSSKDERLLRITKRDRDMADALQRRAARLAGGGSVTGGG